MSSESQPTGAIEVFYSYSHKDEELRDQLENHLAMLRRDGIIKSWHDRRIIAGQDWGGKIDEHLNSAEIILLLVSSDFLASDYCYDIEVKQAMKRHQAGEARVIPIILRPCDWQRTPFGKVQGLPKDAKPTTRWEDRDEAFLDIAKGIRKAAEEISSQQQAKSPPTSETDKPVPHLNIPKFLVVDFVARKDREGSDIVERLKKELAPREKRLIVLWGAGGVGKTAIAAEAARALTEAFGQRIVWVSADGRDSFNLSTLLDEIAHQLGGDELRPLAIEPKKEAVRDVVTAAPALIVLDNFETITPAEGKLCAEWLAQPALCSALITSRQNIDIARNISIDAMRSEEARDLLQRLIAQVHDAKAFENLDHEHFIETAEANPLVMQWIVGQIDLAQDPQEVLDDLAHGEGTAAQRVFDRSYNLPQLTKGGRAALLALSLFVPSATRPMLAEVAGLEKKKDRQRFKDAIKILSSLWLVHTTNGGTRLAVEGLTRELARARLSTDPRGKTFPPRFVLSLLRYADTHRQLTFANLNALEDERDNVLAGMDIAYRMGAWNSVMRIYDAIDRFLDLRGYWDEKLQRNQQAIQAARATKHERAVAGFSVSAAITLISRGELDTARHNCEQGLAYFRSAQDEVNIAITLNYLGIITRLMGKLTEAEGFYTESLEIHKKLDAQQGIATNLHQLSLMAGLQDDLSESKRLCIESLDISKRINDQLGIATNLHHLGSIARLARDFAEARNFYSESLEIFNKLGNLSGIAETLHDLGLITMEEGDYVEAKQLLLETIKILEKLGSPDAEIARRNLERVEDKSS